MSLRAHNLCQENYSIVNYTNRLWCEHDTFYVGEFLFLKEVLWGEGIWMKLGQKKKKQQLQVQAV